MRYSALRLVFLSWLVSTAFALSGCASSSLFHWKDKSFTAATAANPVTKIICLWQPADGHTAENRPTRGFAGQIYFFAQDGKTPLTVDGDVRIYVFDDQGTIEEQAKPMHQFDYVDGAWKTHLYDTQLGPAYHVFVPYTRPGFHHAECSLRLRLKPTEGQVVYSDMVHVVMNGSTKKAADTSKSKDAATDGVQPTSDAAAKVSTIESGRKYSSTEIARSNSDMSHMTTTPHEDADSSATMRDNQVQPAAATAGVPLESPETQRLRKIEETLELLVRQRADESVRENNPVEQREARAIPEPARIRDMSTPNRNTDKRSVPAASVTSARRFQLTPTQPTTATQHPLSEVESREPAAHPLEQAGTPVRAAHPLETSTTHQAAAVVEQTPRHPLEQPGTARVELTHPLESKSATVERHPLTSATTHPLAGGPEADTLHFEDTNETSVHPLQQSASWRARQAE